MPTYSTPSPFCIDRVFSAPQEQKQRGLAPTRGRLDDHTNQNEQSHKRPSLIDTHHISKRSSTGKITTVPYCLLELLLNESSSS